MSNKRNLKRGLNNMILDVVGECFHVQEADPKKTAVTEALFDKAAEFQDIMLQEIHAAKSKKDFRPIVNKINEMQVVLTNELNNL